MKFQLEVLYNCENSSETELEMFAEETEIFSRQQKYQKLICDLGIMI